jgi:predicted dehydrogenase
MTSVEPLRIAMIGCGAVTERAHLPVCTNTEDVRVVALVDTNIERARNLAREFRVPTVQSNTEGLVGLADAAILAVPHALHERIASDLLRKGIHVLVEKPMALTVAECDNMIKAAEAGGAVLAVGLMRRFAPWARLVKHALAAGAIGKTQMFEIREGSRYSWPVASDFFFKKETAGGGVLIDTGAHTLDMVLWWFGDVEQIEYFDDADGGVEADCEIHLTLANKVQGRVELSRTRELGFRIQIRGDQGTLEVQPYMKNPVAITYRDCQLAGTVTNPKDYLDSNDYLSMIGSSFRDWVSAIRTKTIPTVDGHEGRRAIALIETCYALRQPLLYPWVQNEITQSRGGVA